MGVVSGLDGEQTTTPRCAFFEGEPNEGDKVLFTINKTLVEAEGEWVKYIPGWKKGGNMEDPGDRFEEAVTGWCVLSPENPTDRDFEFKTLEGGVGETYIKFTITTGDSGHGEAKDPIAVIVW